MGSARGPFACLLAFVLLLLAGPAAAVDEATRSMIREISGEGVAAYQDGEYELARQKLDQAFSMLPTAPLGLWSARTLEKLGLLVEARERYLAAERAPTDPGGDRELQKQARQDAVSEREALEARIPKVVVRLRAGPATEGDPSRDVTLSVGGKSLPAAFVGTAIPVNPGRLQITAVRNGEHATKDIDIDAGERKEVTLVLQPGPPADPVTEADPAAPVAEPGAVHDEAKEPKSRGSWQPIAGWIGIGLGVGGLALGGVGSALVYDKLGALDCDGEGCPPGTSAEEMAAGNSLRTMSTVGYVVGGVLLATGVTLLLTAPKKDRQVGLRSTPGGAAVFLSGTF
jgi:hypothetical protein